MKCATSCLGRLLLSADNQACPWSTSAPMLLDKHSDGTHAVLSLTAQCPAAASAPKTISANYSLFFDVDPSHRGLPYWYARPTNGSRRQRCAAP